MKYVSREMVVVQVPLVDWPVAVDMLVRALASALGAKPSTVCP